MYIGYLLATRSLLVHGLYDRDVVSVKTSRSRDVLTSRLGLGLEGLLLYE